MGKGVLDMDLKQKIYRYIEKCNKTININRIKREFKISYDDVQEVLKELELDAKVILNDDIVRIFPDNNIFYQGTIYIDKLNNGYLKSKNQRFVIPTKCLNGSLNGDTVLIAKGDSLEDGRFVAVVKKIIKRKKDYIACVKIGDSLTPYGINIPYKLEIEGDYSHIEDYTALLIELDNKIKNKTLTGRIVKTITHRNDPNYEEKIIATLRGFPLTFSYEALEEANNINEEITEEDIKNRKDFRDELIFTIDCDETKDMDDAVSIKKDDNGHYHLGVHIAHVAHYIKPGSCLWNEALERGTSVYMANSVIPMLPQRLSNGICSLNPNEDKLTLSTMIEFDNNGKIVDYEIVESVIQSRAKLKYSEVNELLENNNNVANYPSDICSSLELMQELSQKIENQKEKRGCLSFESSEIKIHYDENNEPCEFVQRESRSAEKLIENFMVSANECVAQNYSWMPFLYRVHDKPDNDKLEEILDFISNNFQHIPRIQNFSNKAIQNILMNLKNNTEKFKLFSSLILPSMARAKFSTINIGHFGLALDDYSQSTSPIRRFNDLVIQHMIEICETVTADNYDSIQMKLEDIAKHCSNREYNADMAEREANNVEMAKYINNHIGESFKAIITQVNNNGITILTDNNITGFIPFDNIKNDYYTYNHANRVLLGKHHNNKIAIGDKIIARAQESSIGTGLVLFEYVNKLEKHHTLTKSKN